MEHACFFIHYARRLIKTVLRLWSITDLIARSSELHWNCHGTLSIRVSAELPLHYSPQGTQAPDNARNIIPNAL